MTAEVEITPHRDSHKFRVAGHRIKRLVERPARQTLDEWASAAEINFVFFQGHVETSGERFVAPDGLPKAARHYHWRCELSAALPLVCSDTFAACITP